MFVGFFAILGIISSLLLVDKIGRRILLLISYAILCACFLVLATYFQLQINHPEVTQNYRIVPVIAISLYAYMNTFGAASVAMVMLGEIFPQNVKDVAAGISMTCNYAFSIVVAFMFPYLTETVGSNGAFYVFSGFNAIIFVFVMFCVPETKGKSLNEIQRLLLKR